jgi:hypothetical protein
LEEDSCDCDGNIEDCNGDCGGDAFLDECGVCDGESSTCSNGHVVLSFYDLGGVTLTNISYDKHLMFI